MPSNERWRLTDSERQEVRRYLDADKPLPDKFRFLLFEDKREVELVWNGKTNQVCNLVLPFQTIEHVDEPRIEKPVGQMELFDARRRQESWTAKRRTRRSSTNPGSRTAPASSASSPEQ